MASIPLSREKGKKEMNNDREGKKEKLCKENELQEVAIEEKKKNS